MVSTVSAGLGYHPEERTLTVTTLPQETPRDDALPLEQRPRSPAARLLVSTALVVASIATGLGAGRGIHHLRG